MKHFIIQLAIFCCMGLYAGACFKDRSYSDCACEKLLSMPLAQLANVKVEWES